MPDVELLLQQLREDDVVRGRLVVACPLPGSGEHLSRGARVAQRVDIVLVDDLDGTLADETVHFSLDGSAFEIDLSSENAGSLRAAVRPYLEAGRRVRPTRKVRASKSTSKS